MTATENARVMFSHAPDVLVSVRHFRVEERASQNFRVDLEVVSSDSAIDLERLTGSHAVFELSWNVERRLYGLVETARFLRVAEDDSGLATYAITLVPALFRLGSRVQNRLFQHQSIPEMVEHILAEHGILSLWRLAEGAHAQLELRTQYGESDLTFITRLLEEAGITFTFAEPTDADSTLLADEPASMVLVLSDEPQGGPERPGPPIPFLESGSLARASRSPFLTRVSLTSALRPGSVTLRDNDFRRPRFALYSSATGTRASELAMEQYRYAPGDFLAEQRGALLGDASLPTPVGDDRGVARHSETRAVRQARGALEALQADRTLVTFETSVIDLSPGTVFRVIGHPRAELAPTSSLLVVRSSLEGEVANVETWKYSGIAVPTRTPWRPARVTPKPRMPGVQTAVVVGAESAAPDWVARPGGVGRVNAAALDSNQAAARLVDNDIYTDEHGRVRVQFPWDREGGYNGQSSAWMRVSQGWAGRGYGMFALPRVGHEVLVAFVDGDPDCPIVAGRLHNALEPPPFKLPENKAVSTWRSASSPGGAGFNELRFDDALGCENVFLQAERDMDRLVKNDSRDAIGGDRSAYVQKDETRAIGRDLTEIVNANACMATALNRAEVAGVNRTSTVGAEDSTIVGARWSVTVARGLTGRLTREIELAAQSAGGVLRSAASGVLGLLPQDPRASAAESALAELGRKSLGKLRDVAALLRGFETDPGPPPTSIEMVDRQIKLGTGEASIVIDGPNIVLTAQGNITLHALGHVSVLSERELALAGQEKVAIVSAKDDVIVQAGKDVHLNPFEPARGAARAISLEEGALIGKPKCGSCGGELGEGPAGQHCERCRDMPPEADGPESGEAS